MLTLPLYKHLARALKQKDTVVKGHTLASTLSYRHLPSGAGIDSGSRLDYEASNPNKLIIIFEYHHMNNYGIYTHWTAHKCTVTPSLFSDFDLKITKGKTSNSDIEYLHDVFNYALREEIEI